MPSEKKSSSSKEKKEPSSSKKKSSSSSSSKKKAESSSKEKASEKSSKSKSNKSNKSTATDVATTAASLGVDINSLKDEDDDFEEKQFILRVPEDIAEKIRQRLRKESKDSKSSDKNHRIDLNMSIKFGDDVDILQFLQSARMTEEDKKIHKRDNDENGYLSDIEYGIDKNRRGRFQFEKQILPCTLVDLPTHIEAYKSVDCQTYYKCGDVSQMIVVQKPQDLESEFQKFRQKRTRFYMQKSHHHHDPKKRKAKDLMTSYLMEDGISPSLARVLRHWNAQKIDITRKDIKKLKEKYIQMLEEEDPTKVKIEFIEYASEQERLAAMEEEMSTSSSDSEASDSEEESDESDMFDEVSANKKPDDAISTVSTGDQSKLSSAPSQPIMNDDSMSVTSAPSSMSTPISQAVTTPNQPFVFSAPPTLPKPVSTSDMMQDETPSEGEESHVSNSTSMSKQSLGPIEAKPVQPIQANKPPVEEDETSSDSESESEDDENMFEEVSATVPQQIDVTQTPQYQSLLQLKNSAEKDIQTIQNQVSVATENLEKSKNEIQRGRAQAMLTNLEGKLNARRQELLDVERQLTSLMSQPSSSSSSTPPF
ncbi:hypothetical protein C9374_006661 [Naegleria lovaniensis]|uniref:TAFII55 protein conserved region domain-containing protein n=1 Tax=Naegleria lovaniensis TaxID=51637 RepID=A0AA88KM48_NAELO|nr:uncharacterized protein C9374_006661 [Naegleria lovaniensis]KAG2379544.1 hypothetical protein C9374_006661 [Naegleria lovaniensis]